MKKIPLIFIMILSAGLVFGQSSRQTGPAAKNAKPWADQQSKQQAYSMVDVKTTQGPAAKNLKAWEPKDTTLKLITNQPIALKGPRAKNQKPWDN